MLRDIKRQYLLLYQLGSIEIVLKIETIKNALPMKFVWKNKPLYLEILATFNYLPTYNIDPHKMAYPFYFNFLIV